jgi:endoglucanase
MTKKMAVAIAALVALSAAIAAGSFGRIATRALGYWNSRKRYAMRVVEPPFAHVAVSQVGFGPSMLKQFTAPREFGSFRVLRDGDGSIAFAGGPPVRSVDTDILGPIRTVYIGDFSALSAPGRYHLVDDKGEASFAFEIGPAVFDPAVRAVQRWFYYQRAFTATDRAHAEGPWFHASDADKAPPGVRMGWHDAGDFSVYSTSLNTALFWLLEAWSDFAPGADDTNIPESGNGVPDLLDEARWGVEWLLSVQDASGGFANSTCEERYRAYGSNAIEDAAPYKSGEVGTLATARAVGNLAYASAVYRRLDAPFAERCLEAARAGYRYLLTHRDENTDGPTCPAARADGDAAVGRQVRMFAAAGMLLATSEKEFRDDFERSYVELDYDPSYLHMNGFAAQLYLKAPAGEPARKAAIRERLRIHAGAARKDGERHPFGFSTRNHWGTIGAGFTRVGSYNVKRCLDDAAANGDDCEQALADVHYTLGRNFLQFCYVSGLPGTTRARTHAFHHWLATLQAQPFCFPGMVAAGPNAYPEADDQSKPYAWPIPVWGYWGDPALPRGPDTPLDGRYTDNDSWSTNEVDVDWQGSALYNLYFAQWMARRAPRR